MKENFQKAQEIKEKLKEYAIGIIKPGENLVEIAEKIEKKILELECKPAFPISLAIDEIAAHYNPQPEDKAKGLLKVDLGFIYKNIIIDFAFSIDLTKEQKYKKLIESSEKALESVRGIIKKGTELNKIGKKIQEIISSYRFAPIRNLAGHSLNLKEVHAGITIPNYDNGNTKQLEQGLFAVEPFSTTGEGVVIDGKKSGIYSLIEKKPIRDPLARKIIDFIEKTYSTLPFCDRWIIKEFGSKAKFSLKLLEQEGILKNYPILIEKSKQPVAHTEDTFLIE